MGHAIAHASNAFEGDSRQGGFGRLFDFVRGLTEHRNAESDGVAFLAVAPEFIECNAGYVTANESCRFPHIVQTGVLGFARCPSHGRSPLHLPRWRHDDRDWTPGPRSPGKADGPAHQESQSWVIGERGDQIHVAPTTCLSTPRGPKHFQAHDARRTAVTCQHLPNALQ